MDRAPKNCKSNRRMEYKWNRNLIELLISNLERREVIYDLQHKDHYNRYKRADAYEELCEELRKYDPTITLPIVKKKVKNLRTQFSHELRRMSRSKKSGKAVLIPKLWCFESLEFLRDHTKTDEQAEADILKKEESENDTSPLRKISGEKIQHLIQLVKERPCLYSASACPHTNNKCIVLFWDEIAASLEMKRIKCRSIWKYLLDQFENSLRNNTYNGKKLEINKSEQKYLEQLSFLDPPDKDQTISEFETSTQKMEYSPDYGDEFDYSESEVEIKENESSGSPTYQPTKRLKSSEDENNDEVALAVQEMDMHNSPQILTDHSGTLKFFESLAFTLLNFNVPPLDLMEIQNNIYSFSIQQLRQWRERQDQ